MQFPQSPQGLEPWRQRAWAGRPILAVLALVAIAVLAYWSMRPTNSAPATQAASSSPAEARATREALEDLGTRFKALADRQDLVALDILRRDVQQLVQRYPNSAQAHLLLCQVLFVAGDLDQAYEAIRRSLELDAQSPKVHQMAGTLAATVGKHEAAAGHFSTALSLAPQDTSYRLNLAQAYLDLHRWDDARRLLLEVLQADSSSHQAHLMLADLYAAQGKLDLAVSQAQKALETLPAGADQHRLVYVIKKARYLRRANQPEAALQTLFALPEADQLEPAALDEQAAAWAALDKPGEAAKLYERALAVRPADWRLAAQATHWWLKAGDKPAARRSFDHLRRINPNAPGIADFRSQIAD